MVEWYSYDNNKGWRNPKGQLRMVNSEIQATWDTRHRTKTKKTNKYNTENTINTNQQPRMNPGAHEACLL